MKNKMKKSTDIKREEKFTGKLPKEVFTEVFTINDWSSTESHSGMGSTLQYTTNTRKRLPSVFGQYGIKKVLDIGCGDFNWMKEIVHFLDYYKGTDVVEAITNLNKERYEEKNKIEFETSDITEGCNYERTEFNSIILKDVLVHFPTDVVIEVLNRIKSTGIKYVFITHFTETKINSDITAFGQWRPLNMSLSEFDLGDPLEIIKEEAEEYMWDDVNLNDKTLSLWQIN